MSLSSDSAASGSRRLLIFASIALGAAGASVAGPAGAQEGPDNLHASLTLATDYVHWGLSQLDSGPSLIIAVDFEHDTGFFAGASAGNVEFATESLRAKPRKRILYAYLGGAWRGRVWSGNVAIARSAYPDITYDYDYNELVASVSYRGRVFLTASRTDDLLSLGSGATQVEIGTVWPMPWDLEISAGLGQLRTSDLPKHRYTHGNIGVSKVVGRFGIDLRYHDTTLDAANHLGDPVRGEWVASLSYAIAPRT